VVFSWRLYAAHRFTLPRKLTDSPNSSSLNIYRYRDGLYAVDLITAALSLIFFTWMQTTSATIGGICEHFGFKKHPAHTMLTLFAANGRVGV
jgi:hypothetical protein